MSRLFDLRNEHRNHIELLMKEVHESFYLTELKKIQKDCEHIENENVFTCCSICGADLGNTMFDVCNEEVSSTLEDKFITSQILSNLDFHIHVPGHHIRISSDGFFYNGNKHKDVDSIYESFKKFLQSNKHAS
jgi:hypothetical protein